MFELMIPRRSRRSAAPALRDVRALDALFDEMWRGIAPRVGTLPGFSPRIDLRESDEAFVLRAELPGLDENDFEIALEDDVLTLKGEKKTEHEEEREGLRHVETRSGSFERRFRLPVPVKADDVKATFEKGVLTVTLPKPEEERPQVRTIPVSTS
ncbi:MAG: Hsp20/alpha crystallin family protein [Myxococcota bacterium]|nr:Hsp20/alpha crystallin family protein [Myxococcota bacterium]